MDLRHDAAFAELIESREWTELPRLGGILNYLLGLNIMKIYTRTGDDGSTGLFRGPRTSKDDSRIEAYGAVDELNSWIGFARAEVSDAELDTICERIQGDLFSIGAEYATPQAADSGMQLIETEDTERLESWIDEFESQLEPLQTFVLPGGVELAARFHVCRTVCRRAERRAWTLAKQLDANLGEESLKYLNRLSDLLFVLARYANHLGRSPDVPWTPK